MREGEGWRQFHAGTLPLELFRSDTPGYKMNLAQRPPRVFVVLRRAAESGAEHELLPYLVTVDAYATEHYADSGEEIVEGVAMPPEVVRSEEHTSELQSLMRISYAVFCLKKKTIIRQTLQ